MKLSPRALRFSVATAAALALVVAVGGATIRSAEASSYTGTITAGGPSVSYTLSSAGDTGTLTFTGAAGERVFVDVKSGSLASPAQYTLRLLDPAGVVLKQAAITASNSTSFLDAITLSSAGTYSITATPNSTTTGTLTFTLYDVPVDASGTITADGTATSITTSTPGQNGVLSFSGTAGERILLRAMGTSFSSPAGSPNLEMAATVQKPDGSYLGGTGWFLQGTSGAKFMDATTLPVSGTYTILVDGYGDTIGTSSLALFNVPPDLSGTITPGGASVTATLTTPGQNASYTFTASAGQRVFLKMTPGALATGMSGSGGIGASIRDANNTSLGSTGWRGSNNTGYVDAVTLATTGTYTVFVDGMNDTTGSATLTLYSVPADVTTPTSLDAPAMSFSLSVGQNASLPFTATAGQLIRFAVAERGDGERGLQGAESGWVDAHQLDAHW